MLSKLEAELARAAGKGPAALVAEVAVVEGDDEDGGAEMEQGEGADDA